MRYVNSDKKKNEALLSDPTPKFIIQTLYSFYRKLGSLDAAIQQAITYLDVTPELVNTVVDEYRVRDEFELGNMGDLRNYGENVSKRKREALLADPTPKFIIQTLYSFYRKLGSLDAAIQQAVTYLDVTPEFVNTIVDEYDLRDEFASNMGDLRNYGD